MQLIYNDKKNTGCLGTGCGGWQGTDCKGAQETFRGDGYIHYFDHGVGFVDIYIS